MDKIPAPIKLTPSKGIAYTAITCALLIGGQAALGFVSGVEIVTIILICFACTFGVKWGELCAVSFSILRCFIWGFYLNVIVLYLIYYPLLALIFGSIGKISDSTFKESKWQIALVTNIILLIVIALCAYLLAFDVIDITRLYRATIKVLLCVILALSCALEISFNAIYVLTKVKHIDYRYLKLLFITAIATICTICFTLIDDVISPLFYGTEFLPYFYASFLAMLPQVICTIATTVTLYYPICAVMRRA